MMKRALFESTFLSSLMKIGIFDSGFGGLSVFKAIHNMLPEYDYLYLGDSARAPYGNHSHEVIYAYVQEAVEYLFEQDCQLIILACNTASAQALRKLQQEWLPQSKFKERRVLGVIRPIAEAVAQQAPGKKIGVIGTRATIEAGVYTKEINQQLEDQATVLEQACPLLVPMIEEGFSHRPEMKKVLKHYLRPLKQQQVEVLINGCTHYQLLHEVIQNIMGKRVIVLDTAAIVADSLKNYLARHPEHEEQLSKQKTVAFYTTDDAKRFNGLATKFFGKPVKAEKVNL